MSEKTIHLRHGERIVQTDDPVIWRKEWRHSDGVWRPMPESEPLRLPREYTEGEGVIMWLAGTITLAAAGTLAWALWWIVRAKL